MTSASRTTVGPRTIGRHLPGLRWTCYEPIHIGGSRPSWPDRRAWRPALRRGSTAAVHWGLTLAGGPTTRLAADQPRNGRCGEM
jgi:hypothetical protein